MATLHHPHGMTVGVISFGARATQLIWFAGGAGLGFLIPYVFSDLLGLQHDAYYAIYFGLVGVFLGAYIRTTGVSVRDTLSRSLPLTLLAGVIISGLEVLNILRTSPVTPHPSGVYFGFELLWRGVVYGIVDALLLSAFPALVAF